MELFFNFFVRFLLVILFTDFLKCFLDIKLIKGFKSNSKFDVLYIVLYLLIFKYLGKV